MTSSAESAAAQVDLAAIAASLCRQKIDGLVVLAGGGNSRVYRVSAGKDRFLLKAYPPRLQDPRDRLTQEFAALTFLSHVDDVGRSPRAIAAGDGFALYEWIDGVAVTAAQSGDLDQIVDFIHLLQRSRQRPEAGCLPFAAEASLSLSELLAQIVMRRHRLIEQASAEPALRTLLDDGFNPLFERARQRAQALYLDAGLAPDRDIGSDQRCLSPSDFGFHNMLRRPDGRLAFIDFEYFGWDDPVRLSVDFRWHPAMRLTPDDERRYDAAMMTLFSGDPAYRTRLIAQEPLIGLRWCMILLNAFLPDRWDGRVHGGQQGNRQEIIARQLVKAQNALRRVEQTLLTQDREACL